MKQISKIMLSITIALGCSFTAQANDAGVSPVAAPSVVTDPMLSPTPIPLTQPTVDIKQSGGENSTKKEDVKKEKKALYTVTKSTLYNQVAYDFAKKGYSVVWNLKIDPSFKKGEYKSIEDQMVYSLNRLNEVVGGNFEDGNMVQGLICPLNKSIHFVYSSNSAGVVDKNGVSCNLITPISQTELLERANNSAAGVIPNAQGGSNYYQEQNVLGGPMIIQ